MSIQQATPRAYIQGFDDQSIRALLVEPVQIPQHLPLWFILAERGPADPQFAIGDDLNYLYGSNSFNTRKEYFQHSTMGLVQANSNANLSMVQRLIPADAKKSTVVFWVEVILSDLVQYQRNADGSFVVNQGAKVPTGDADVEGYKLRWFTEALPEGTNLNGLAPKVGPTAGKGGTDSTCYPVAAYQVTHHGKYGDNVGISLWSPNQYTVDAPNESALAFNEAMPYRIKFWEREDVKSSPGVEKTIAAEHSVEFMFKEGAVDKRIDADLFYTDRVPSMYRSVDATTGMRPTFGPMDDQHIYFDRIDELLGLLYAKENAADPLILAKEMINFLSGVDQDGVAYKTIEVLGAVDGGISMTESSCHYATGGSDGTLGFDSLDSLVAARMSSFEETDAPLTNDAKYPFSTIWDTGFTLDTKKKLLRAIGLRPDVWVALATQAANEEPNSASDDSSIAISLRSAARMYPESMIHGTPTCRAVVTMRDGALSGSNYSKRLPLNMALLIKMCKYAGAGDGRMKPELAFDTAPANQITEMKDLQYTFLPDIVRDNDWKAGAIWPEDYDHRIAYFPQFQTVYDNDTSIFNSLLNMHICVDVTKICMWTHRNTTGNSKRTRAQNVDHVNGLIADRVADRYDGRVDITPNTYYTAADDARNYSYTTEVDVAGNGMITVGTFSVVGKRREG